MAGILVFLFGQLITKRVCIKKLKPNLLVVGSIPVPRKARKSTHCQREISPLHLLQYLRLGLDLQRTENKRIIFKVENG
jgi:hypothetical protein